MKTVRDLLRDADPLHQEPPPPDGERQRLRQAVVAASSGVANLSSATSRKPLALATVALMLAGIVAVGFQMWSTGGVTLQAAIRFEVRLAEEHPGAELLEARIAGSDRLVYLHREVIVTNEDIAGSRLVEGEGSSSFGVAVEFNATGTRKMRQATAAHIGRPVAILIDGEVVAALVVRGPISSSAVISGDYTQAEAERIADGISMR